MTSSIPLIICSKTVDVAVMTQALQSINIRNDEHRVVLDKIVIDSTLFRSIFYSNGNNFALNQAYLSDLKSIIQYVSLDDPYRTVNGNDFCLVDTIYDNIEEDLGVLRDNFTPCSNIALNTELSGIKTLYDLKKLTPACALTWETLENLAACECDQPVDVPTNVRMNLVITVVFSTDTVGTTSVIKPTVLRLFYETTFLVQPNSH